MTEADMRRITDAQRAFFNAGSTKDVAVRIDNLLKLKAAIKKHEKDLSAALKADLNKSEFEAYATEIGLALEEISYIVKHVRRWAKPRRVSSPLAQFPSKSVIYSEPFGLALIMSPWNYPALLSITPLAGALAAGNCVVLKPSNYSPAVSACLKTILGECFDERLCAVVTGGRTENQALLEQRFDFIFFTGGTEVGRFVMQQAAKYLTPVALELGGKSPCLVQADADIPLAAKRIAWGKFINAGQTCVAPDFVYAHESVAAELVSELKKNITQFFGAAPLTNPDFCKIITQKHFERISSLITAPDEKGAAPLIAAGGKTDAAALKIEPTVLTGVNWEHPVMKEEIFGPVLPVLTFSSAEQAVETLQKREKPLALYHFTRSAANEKLVLHSLSHGGGCINDTVVHLATAHMPFGGVGNSGMGGYHGKFSFDTFSHQKSILKKALWLDLPMRYAPYREAYLKMIRMIMR